MQLMELKVLCDTSRQHHMKVGQQNNDENSWVKKMYFNHQYNHTRKLHLIDILFMLESLRSKPSATTEQ